SASPRDRAPGDLANDLPDGASVLTQGQVDEGQDLHLLWEEDAVVVELEAFLRQPLERYFLNGNDDVDVHHLPSAHGDEASEGLLASGASAPVLHNEHDGPTRVSESSRQSMRGWLAHEDT